MPPCRILCRSCFFECRSRFFECRDVSLNVVNYTMMHCTAHSRLGLIFMKVLTVMTYVGSRSAVPVSMVESRTRIILIFLIFSFFGCYTEESVPVRKWMQRNQPRAGIPRRTCTTSWQHVRLELRLVWLKLESGYHFLMQIESGGCSQGSSYCWVLCSDQEVLQISKHKLLGPYCRSAIILNVYELERRTWGSCRGFDVLRIL